MEWLRSYRPDLVERYEELYRTRRVPAAGRARADRRGSCGGRAGGAGAAVGAFRREPGRDYERRCAPPDPAQPSGHRGAPEREQTTLF